MNRLLDGDLAFTMSMDFPILVETWSKIWDNIIGREELRYLEVTAVVRAISTASSKCDLIENVKYAQYDFDSCVMIDNEGCRIGVIRKSNPLVHYAAELPNAHDFIDDLFIMEHIHGQKECIIGATFEASFFAYYIPELLKAEHKERLKIFFE